jgi:hypothetical protein
MRSRVFAGAKQVMFWRKVRAQPASAGNPGAAAIADTARPDNKPSTPASQTKRPEEAAKPVKAAQTAASVAPPIAETVPPPVAAPKTAPPPPATPIPVASPPEIKAVPVYAPKAAAPEIPNSIPPPPTALEDDVVDRIYAKIAKELETGSMIKGLWTRLYAECDGDEKRAKVLYIKQRAEKLIAAERLRQAK